MTSNLIEIYDEVEKACGTGNYREAAEILLKEPDIRKIISGEEPIEVISSFKENILGVLE